MVVILLGRRKTTDGDGSDKHGGFNGLDEDKVMMLRSTRERRMGMDGSTAVMLTDGEN